MTMPDFVMIAPDTSSRSLVAAPSTMLIFKL